MLALQTWNAHSQGICGRLFPSRRVSSSRKCVFTSPPIWMGNAEGRRHKTRDTDIRFFLGLLNAVEILPGHPVAFCLLFMWSVMTYDTCCNTKEIRNHADDASINGQNTPPIIQQQPRLQPSERCFHVWTHCNSLWTETPTAWVEQRMSHIQTFVFVHAVTPSTSEIILRNWEVLGHMTSWLTGLRFYSKNRYAVYHLSA